MFIPLKFICKTLKVFLKKIDMFGRKTELSMNKETSYTTVLGGFLSLIMITISIVLFVNFGSDMVYRQNPTVIFSEIYTKNPERTYFSTENFFFMFGVEAPNFTHFIDDTIYEVKVTHRKFSSKANDSFSIDVPIERCREDHLPQKNQQLHDYFLTAPKVPIENLICLQNIENYFMEGSFDSDAYTFLEINIYVCSNATRKTNDIPCKPPEMINTVLEGFFALYTMDYLFDPQNYENPGSNTGVDYFTPLSVGIKRYTNRFISTTNVQTDDGVLFSNSQITHSYPNYENDKESLLIDSSDEGMLMDFIFRKYHSEMLYDRSYKKLQDVFAEIGGFTQILYLIFFVFSYPFIAKKYYEKIINLIYNFENNTNEQHKNIQVFEKSLRSSLSKHITSINPTTVKIAKSNSILNANKKSTEKAKEHFMKYMSKIRNKLPLKTSYWEFIVNTFMPLKQPTQGTKIKRLKTGEKIISEKIDISYILKKFYEIDKLKMILFNSNQYHLFEYLPKPIILRNSKIDLGNAKNSKFITYESNAYGQAKKLYGAYQNIINQDQLSPLDQKLIDLLDDNVRGVLEVRKKFGLKIKLDFRKKK